MIGPDAQDSICKNYPGMIKILLIMMCVTSIVLQHQWEPQKETYTPAPSLSSPCPAPVKKESGHSIKPEQEGMKKS
jgi:hypothetical protein